MLKVKKFAVDSFRNRLLYEVATNEVPAEMVRVLGSSTLLELLSEIDKLSPLNTSNEFELALYYTFKLHLIVKELTEHYYKYGGRATTLHIARLKQKDGYYRKNFIKAIGINIENSMDFFVVNTAYFNPELYLYSRI